MDPNRCKDSGEMYSPDDQEEYTSLDETPQFSLQGLSDALADVREGMGNTSAEEYALMLEVMVADCPGRPRPPTFSWNVGMVMHVLKSDPVLWELEHVQVDGPGTAYLLFYSKQGHRGLEQDTADAVQIHVEEAFLEWISCSAHQLVGSAPQQDGRTSGMEEKTEARLADRTGTVQLHRRPPKTQCTMVGGGGSPPSSPDRGVPDSDRYSTVSETVGCQHRCRGCRGSRERK